ncbi:MAG: hypothetical protein ACKO0Z_20815 [Betaproteobacteria bacterium]
MADFMRTFNAATDDPENVSKYRAANPIFSAPAQEKPAAPANSNVEMIGGIPHMKLQSNERAGPLDAMAQGYSGVASALLGGMTPSTRAEEARKKSREGLDTSAAQINPSPSVKPAAIPAPTSVSATPQNPQPNVVTQPAAKDAGLMPSERHNTGTMVDMSADNKAMAAANATRQQMVDMQPKGGAGILRDSAADAWNARMDKEGQVQKITDMMARNPNMAGALSGALNQTVAGQTQQEVEQMRQQGVMAGVDTQRRGQDIAAKNEAARLAGNPVDNSLKQQQVIAAQGANDRQSKLNGILAGIEKEQDPAKRSALMDQYLEASGKETKDRFIPTTKKIYNEMGQIVGEDVMGFDKRTGLPVSGNAPAGNDAAQKIKADVAAGKMTREDAIKQLKAMGYN